MADVQQLETTKTTTTTNNVEEFDLELSLGFRSSKKLLQPINNNNHVVSKREEQAIRRHEAKVKRDLKRKFAANNGVVIEEENGFESRRKVASFSYGGNNVGGFRPYMGHNGKFNEVDGETRSSISTGSSSGVSDYNNNNNYHSNNSSAAGGSSSDASSHLNQPPLHIAAPNVPTTNVSQAQPYSSSQETQLNTSNLNVSQPQLYSSSSNQTELLRSLSQTSRSLEKTISGNIVAPPSENLSKGKSSPDKELTPTPRSPSPKDTKVVIGKPPKPNGQTSQQKAVLPQMPCVSATGNGPTGKTITGFLYKYSKTEVCIVCVCHGTSFTPAGFVEHAGGVDIENPLRHIRVVPFGL